jgi:hypothetical protein
MRSFVICTFAAYNWNDELKYDMMGRECSTNMRRGRACVIGKARWKGTTRKIKT